MNKIKDWVYCNGFYFGLGCVIAPITYDILWVGVRSSLVWSVGVTGMAVQIFGLGLIFLGGRDSK